ncbi:dynein regulatory complex subunit 2 [Protopterus annectens]|uniref:dynein regulatory complex subunit 2 n=1 Tax=Protopterus annectens TaxID=7888 RepID=UPI001CFB743B|nr:dynein regulatory complex subunit 2 [Protopterus annectens]XP_043939728.1 dynein regulatory complex subunit 2 [Protopterus annectens]
MPKKARKKSAKMANMTEEERLLYLQQKMLAEEELNKKKEDMLCQFLKDKLSKEEKNSNINMNKITQQWRTIMRGLKAKELRKDIDILSQTFERVVDRKDSVIKSLAKDIEEAEEQYCHNLRAHLQNGDKLVSLQHDRLQALWEEYEAGLEALKEEFDSERQLITEQHQQEVCQLQDILYAIEENYSEYEAEAKQEFQSMSDEIKNKNLEEKHALRIQLEGTVEDLWRQFQQALKNYNDATSERKTAFEALKARDEKSAKEIEMQMKKLQKIQDSITAVKSKMVVHARDKEERNKKLREEKEIIHKYFQKLKSQMNLARNQERQRLAKLTLESNAAIKKLQSVLEKGEHILRLAEMCRKLETEEEKVLPFYASSLTLEEQDAVKEANEEQPTEQFSRLMQDYTALENFWKRYNKVLLDKLALDREKAVLSQQNQQLRVLLKQYLDGISVNQEVLSQLNPLLIVNNKSNVKMNIPVVDSRVKRPVQTVIEASHMTRHKV